MFESKYSHYISIDVDADEIEHNEEDEFLQNVNRFVEDQLSNLYTSDSNRQYKIKERTTQVINNIDQMLGENDLQSRTGLAETIARRLLNKEKDVQDRITHLDQDVQKGGLVITNFKKNDIEYIALVKIHYIDFYEEDTFKENRGLPKKDVVLKTAICKVIDENLDDDFYLSDSTKTKGAQTAKFWWDDFLELNPLKTDKDNTRTVFSKVDQLLRNDFYKKYREDYWFLRNNLVSYLRSEDYFSLNDMTDRMLGNLNLELLNGKNDEEKQTFKEGFKGKISNLKEKNGQRVFDTEFTIDKNEVKAKIKKKITLMPNVDLNINGEVEDLKQKIVPGIDNGKKCLKIYTDTGYDEFKSTQ